MRSTRSTGTSEGEWPVFSIGLILVHFGGEMPMEDRGWHAYRCPIHGDRQASASVNTIEQVFNCHACDAKGNAVTLLMQQEGLSYADAVNRAAEITGESNPSVRPSSGSRTSVSRRTRDRSGSRSGRRSWRSD